jgi:hypothetical protein
MYYEKMMISHKQSNGIKNPNKNIYLFAFAVILNNKLFFYRIEQYSKLCIVKT